MSWLCHSLHVNKVSGYLFCVGKTVVCLSICNGRIQFNADAGFAVLLNKISNFHFKSLGLYLNLFDYQHILSAFCSQLLVPSIAFSAGISC